MAHEEVPFGLRVRLARVRAGLRQRDLATAAGVDPSTISMIETGKSRGNVDTVARLARALDVPIAELLADDPSEEVA